MALTATTLPFLLFHFMLLKSTICQIPPTKVTSNENRNTWGPPRPSSPLIGDDGMVYSCHGKTLLALHPNGTVAWALPLGYSCRPDAPLLTDGYGKIYLIAEDRVIKVIPSNVASFENAVEIFFGPGSNLRASGRIIGICVNIWSSVMFINIERRGIFAFGLRGQTLWSGGPLLYRFGYLQGCGENATRDCYFSSPPSCDQCEGTLYISNNEGQLYCMYTRSPNFKWIQDLSSVDRSFTVTPGNSGHLYVTFPRKAILMALDAGSGDILWKNFIGPLSSEDNKPVSDFNGWVSIGSSDGYLYSFSPNGTPRKFLESTAIHSIVHTSPFLDRSGFAIYISQTRMESKIRHTSDKNIYVSASKPIDVFLTALVPATGTVYWTGKYPGELSSFLSGNDLDRFRFDERILLALLASSGIKEFSTSLNTRQKLEWTCSQARHKHPSIYTVNERTILLFLLFQLVVLVLMALFVWFCCVFWQKKKVKELSLSKFIARRRALHLERKTCIKKISELELEATMDEEANEAIEELRNVVRTKETIERKLSTTYSLGRDGAAGSERERVLSPYGGKSRSYSFHSANKESLTIFNAISDASTSSSGNESDSGSDSDSDSDGSDIGSCKMLNCMDAVAEVEMIAKGKAPLEEGTSSSATKCEFEQKSIYDVNEDLSFATKVQVVGGEGFEMGRSQGVMSKKGMLLKRRTLSSTN